MCSLLCSFKYKGWGRSGIWGLSSQTYFISTFMRRAKQHYFLYLIMFASNNNRHNLDRKNRRYLHKWEVECTYLILLKACVVQWQDVCTHLLLVPTTTCIIITILSCQLSTLLSTIKMIQQFSNTCDMKREIQTNLPTFAKQRENEQAPVCCPGLGFLKRSSHIAPINASSTQTPYGTSAAYAGGQQWPCGCSIRFSLWNTQIKRYRQSDAL